MREKNVQKTLVEHQLTVTSGNASSGLWGRGMLYVGALDWSMQSAGIWEAEYGQIHRLALRIRSHFNCAPHNGQ